MTNDVDEWLAADDDANPASGAPRPKRVIVAAPTGTAARVASTHRVTGCTLHMLFNIRKRPRSAAAPPFVEPTAPSGEADAADAAFHMGSEEVDFAEDDASGAPTASLDVHVKKRLREVRLLIVDEVSMVSSELLDLLDACMRRARNSNARFGGCAVVVVGDFFQLEPILSEADIERSEGRSWAFQSLAWPHFRPMQLIQIVRQQGDQQFAQVLNRMRVGASTAQDATWLNRQGSFWERALPDSLLAIFPSNRKCALRNHQMLARLPGEEITLAPELYCVQLLNTKPWTVGHVSPELLPQHHTLRYHPRGQNPLTLRVGCRIRATRNVYEGTYPDRELVIANGQRGTVTGVDLDNAAGQTVNVLWDAIGTIEAAEIPISRVVWSRRQTIEVHNVNPQGNPVYALARQFPLEIAYALTVHNTQGSSVDMGVDVDHLVLEPSPPPVGRTKWIPQKAGAYVALSRATTMRHVHLLVKFKPEHAVASPTVLAYYDRVFGAVAQ